MSATIIIFGIVLAYMAVNVIIGIQGRKHAGTMDDFLTAGRSSSLLMVTASAAGGHIGSGLVIGTAQNAVTMGMAGGWYAIGCGLSFVFFAILMTKFIHRHNFVTFSDYYKQRYSGKFIVILNSGVGPLALAGSIGAQVMAGKAIFEAFGMNGTVGVIFMAIVVFVYTMFAGLWGSYTTAKFQMGIIVAGLVFAIIYMGTQGGFGEVQAFYPPSSFQLFNIKPETWVMFVAPTILNTLLDQTCIQRANSAKTEKIAFWGHIFGSIPCFLLAFIMVFLGMWAGSLYPEATTGSALIVLMLNRFPTLVCALMIAAILAAIMSTCSAFYVACDALVVHDLYQGFINPNASEKQLKNLNLVLNVAITAVAILAALNFTSIIDLLSSTYTIMISGTMVALFGGLLWKRGTTKGAASAAIIGLATALLGMFNLVQLPFSSIFPLLPSGIAYIVVSLMTQPTEPKAA